MLFCHGEGPRTIPAVCRLPCLQSRYIPYNIYLLISSSIYLMSAQIECVIQVVSWLDCINYTPHLILILIKRTYSKYPALICVLNLSIQTQSLEVETSSNIYVISSYKTVTFTTKETAKTYKLYQRHFAPSNL